MVYLAMNRVNALDVERAHVIGHIFLNGEFNSDGTVNLCATTIDGNLICDCGHFSSATATAVQMERVDVTGHVRLNDGFRAEGTVSLLRARIGGNLECLGGQFSAPDRSPSSDAPRYALQAELSTIGGSVILRPLLDRQKKLSQPFLASGTVSFLNARISGSVECEGRAIINESGDALLLVGAEITGNLKLGPGFHAQGSVNLSRVRVSGGWQMAGFVEADKIKTLDLRFSSATTVEHVSCSWPEPGRLLMDGLGIQKRFCRTSIL